MLKENSILKRLPAALNPKQVLFLDRVRHASELMNFAYARLEKSLAALAADAAAPQKEGTFTTPFIDAWAVVDVIDRLRGLLTLMPGLNYLPLEEGKTSFSDKIQFIRDLRNVSDHLAQRADYVLSRNGTALGTLSWCAPVEGKPGTVKSLAILPGSIRQIGPMMPFPFGDPNTEVAKSIILAAGGYSGDLAYAVRESNRKISELENLLEEFLVNAGKADNPMALDILFCLELQLREANVAAP